MAAGSAGESALHCPNIASLTFYAGCQVRSIFLACSDLTAMSRLPLLLRAATLLAACHVGTVAGATEPSFVPHALRGAGPVSYVDLSWHRVLQAGLQAGVGIAISIENLNKSPDDPIFTSFTPSNATTALTLLGVVTDPETDCQKSNSQLNCRGTLFAPPTVMAAYNGCPPLQLPTFAPSSDYYQCSGGSYGPTCVWRPELENATDAYYAAVPQSPGNATSLCIRLESPVPPSGQGCGAAGVLRVWYVRHGYLYQALQEPYALSSSVNSSRNATICLRTPVVPTITRTGTATRSTSFSASATRTRSPSTSLAASATQTPNSLSATASLTGSRSLSPSPVTPSTSRSLSGTATLSRSFTASATMSISVTASITPSGTDWESMRRAYASLQAAASQAAAAAASFQAAASDALSQAGAASSQLAQQRAVASNAIAAAAAAYAVLNATGNGTGSALLIVAAPDAGFTFPWWGGLIIGLLALLLLACCCFYFFGFLPQRRRLKALEEEQKAAAAAASAPSPANDHRYSRRRLRYSKGGVQPASPAPAGGPKATSPAPPAGSTRGGTLALASQLAFAAGRRGPNPNPTAGAGVGGSTRGGAFVYDANPLLKRAKASSRPVLAVVPTEEAPKAKSQRSLRKVPSASAEAVARLVADDDASSVASSVVTPAASASASLRGVAAVAGVGPEASSPAPAEEAAAAPARAITSEELLASLSFPLDATTAAYLGIDPATGAITNLAAHWAYLRYLEGYDYGTVYAIYAEQLTAAAAEGAATETNLQAALAKADVGTSSAAARRNRGKSMRSGRLLLPPPASGPPPVRLEIGAGNVKSSVVVKERVLLRKVSKVRGDKGFSVTSPIAFEGVKERRDVEIATARRAAAAAGLASPAATGGAGTA